METWFRCRAEETTAACEQALEHLERTGQLHSHLANSIRSRLLVSYYFAPAHVDEAIERVRAVQHGSYGPIAEAWEGSVLGRLYALKGEIERARELVRGGHEVFLGAGLLVSAKGMSMSEAEVEWRSGDFTAGERAMREALELLEKIGDRSYQPTVALDLARHLYQLGRYDEVRPLCTRGRELTGADDLVNFVFLEGLEGGLLAREGRYEEGEAHVRRALELVETADFFEARAWVRLMLAETLSLAGRKAEAAELAAQGLSIREAKGDMAGAARDRVRLEEVGIAVV